MKKEQLRASFARIQPREALVQATLERICEQRARGAVDGKRQSLGFATRLATAACALLLVIGVGVMAARNGLLPSSDAVLASDDERTAPLTVDGQSAEGDAAVEPQSGFVGCEDMIAAARGYGSDWAVGSATVEGVYLAEGMVTLRMTAVADHAASEGAAWSEGDALVAYFDTNNAELCALMTDMGDVLAGLHVEQRDGTEVWVIHEAYAEVATVE